MAIAEHLRAGAVLDRKTISLTTDSVGSGSINLGSTYILLGLQTTKPCRIRLYDDERSRDDATEISRTFYNSNVPNNIALVGDITMSLAENYYKLDPVLYGCIATASNKLTYYRIESVGGPPYPTITFNRFLLEDSSIDINSRRTLPDITGSIPVGTFVTGTLSNVVGSNVVVPRTYFFVSTQVTGSNGSAARVRLRLYSSTGSFHDNTEISRSFTTESSLNSGLLVDALLTGSQLNYFVPKIFGANLQKIGSNLEVVRREPELLMGDNEIYYILQNISAGTATVTASLNVFALED